MSALLSCLPFCLRRKTIAKIALETICQLCYTAYATLNFRRPQPLLDRWLYDLLAVEVLSCFSSLRPVVCAPRRLCAPLPLMASLALAFGLAAPPAHAGSYADTGSGGTSPATVTPAADTISSSPQDAIATGSGNGDPTYTIQISPGTLTDTFTWVPASGQTLTTDPPPNCVLLEQDSGAMWFVRLKNGTGTGSGQADCGLPGGTVTPSTYGSGPSQSLSAISYSQKSGASFSVSCSPTATFTGQAGTAGYVEGEARVSGGARAYPITLNISSGTTKDSSGNPNILVGQQCTATVNGIPSNLLPYTTFDWSGISGTKFESWSVVSDANNQSHTVEVDAIPATNPTQWYWNDSANASETVKCTVTITPPAGQGSPLSLVVTAPKPVSVQVPKWTATGTGGYMQVNNAQPNDTTHDLWAGGTVFEKSNGAYPAGMNWRATLSTPTTPAFGTGSLELVQLVTPSNSYTTVANPTVTVTDPENKNSLSLDGTYPYGSGSEVPAPRLSYQDNDAPSLPLDDANLKLTANKGGSYSDYLMYQAPGSTQWVLLGTFSWSASGSATMPGNRDGSPITPGTNNWPFYTSTSAAGVSDGAGAVTPPGSNPPQTSLPTPVSFTPASTPNTFPKWTHVDLGHTF